MHQWWVCKKDTNVSLPGPCLLIIFKNTLSYNFYLQFICSVNVYIMTIHHVQLFNINDIESYMILSGKIK